MTRSPSLSGNLSRFRWLDRGIISHEIHFQSVGLESRNRRKPKEKRARRNADSPDSVARLRRAGARLLTPTVQRSLHTYSDVAPERFRGPETHYFFHDAKLRPRLLSSHFFLHLLFPASFCSCFLSFSTFRSRTAKLLLKTPSAEIFEGSVYLYRILTKSLFYSKPLFEIVRPREFANCGVYYVCVPSG